VIIRADLGSIKIGNYNFIGPRTVIRPSMKLLKDQLYQTEALFGHHVIIEEVSILLFYYNSSFEFIVVLELHCFCC
jgi:hypothetical protein